LTAASLALANLSSAQYLLQRFDVAPFELPLTLISLTAFLLGVVLTMLLLVISLATPLRLPGLAVVGPATKIKWVNDIKASQLYFYEISGVSASEWQRKWSGDANELHRERSESLVVETHNLSVRTNFKYDRTTEAIAVFSVSLLAFALAVTFTVLAAADQSTGAVVLSTNSRLLIALVLGGYAMVQIMTRIRYARQAIDETTPKDPYSSLKKRVAGERAYAVFTPLSIVAVASEVWERTCLWAVGATVLLLLSLGSFWVGSMPDKPTTPRPNKSSKSDVKPGTLQSLWPVRLITLAVTAALGVLGIMAGIHGNVAAQLLIASIAILFLMLPSALRPTLDSRRRRLKYKERLAKLGGKVNPS
ncbi:MAG: hypothetical protein ACREQV_26120, partial [Candidatus Binatia bacterium]